MIDTERHDFASQLKTIEDCDLAWSQLIEEKLAIESQIATAQERQRRTGIFADSAWLQKAKVALRYKRLKLQQVQDRRAKLRPPKDRYTEALSRIVRALYRHDPQLVEYAVAEATKTAPDVFTPDIFVRLSRLAPVSAATVIPFRPMLVAVDGDLPPIAILRVEEHPPIRIRCVDAI